IATFAVSAAARPPSSAAIFSCAWAFAASSRRRLSVRSSSALALFFSTRSVSRSDLSHSRDRSAVLSRITALLCAFSAGRRPPSRHLLRPTLVLSICAFFIGFVPRSTRDLGLCLILRGYCPPRPRRDGINWRGTRRVVIGAGACHD